MNSIRKQKDLAARRIDGWMSVFAAAKALGVSRQTIYNRCLTGTLQSAHVASRIVISRASVEAAQLEVESTRPESVPA